MLVEAVARRLDGEMRDALARQRSPDPRGAAPDRAWSGRLRASSPGEKMPSVPTLAALRPSVVQMWRTKWTVEDLPLVPVTAAMVAGCDAGEGRGHQRHAPARIGVADDDDRRDRAAAARHRARRGSRPHRASPHRRRRPRRPGGCRPARQTGSRARPCASRGSGRQERDRSLATREMEASRRAALARMSSLSSNATHSRWGCGRGLVGTGPDRQSLALFLDAAMARVRRHELRRRAPAPAPASRRSRWAAGPA